MAKHMSDESDDDRGLFVIPEDDTWYPIPDKVYQVLKWVALILLPAIAVLVSTIGPEWGIPNINGVVTTINAIALFIGTCIGASQLTRR